MFITKLGITQDLANAWGTPISSSGRLSTDDDDDDEAAGAGR